MDHDQHIALWCADLPPSVNELYIKRGRTTFLTESGKQWKNRFKATCGGLSATELMTTRLDPQQDYIIMIWFFLERGDLYNLGHPSMGGNDRRVKHRHKAWDDANFQKITADATAELLGMDDRVFMSSLTNKREVRDGRKTGMLILVQRYFEQYDPFAVDEDLLNRFARAP